MDEGQQVTEIKFFDAFTRIGRLRMFVYPLAVVLLVLPFAILVAVLCFMHLTVLGVLLGLALYVFMITMQFVFMVRRFHDMDRSGWWSLVYGGLYIGSIVATFTAGGHITPAYLTLGLLSLGFLLMLWFTPGSAGANRFGPPPPPNSTWIVVGAWSYLLVPFCGGILAAIAIPAYQDFLARSQTAEGIQLAGGAEVGLSEYFKDNKAWPTELSMVYAAAADNPAGQYVAGVSGAGNGQTYSVVSTLKTTGVNRMVAGKSLEIWTSDGGATWHCGPGGPDPVDPKFLIGSCRDTGAP